MNYITALIEHYLKLDVEKFTDKLISAIQISTVCEFPLKSKNELKFIELNTHEDIMVSFYILDRTINPETKGFKQNSSFARFHQNKPKNSDGESPIIRLPEESIQHYLCLAIRRVSEIVMENTKDYNLEFKMPKKNNEKVKIEF